MMWFFAILVVLALGGVALLAAGRGTPMAEVYDDRPDSSVPATGPLAADDLRRVRFSLAFRGYRMSEVDALLDRLAREREAEAAAPMADPMAEPIAEPAVESPRGDDHTQ
jgi:DivIVA domain-containing protein